MSFFKKLASIFSTGKQSQDVYGLIITVQCNRCEETIQSRVNLMNDLSIEYGDDGLATYFCQKVLMGTQRCFQRIEVTLTFDANRKLLTKEIVGGKFVA